MLVHPWAGLPSRQALYTGIEQEADWELLILTARRWKDDYGRLVDATPGPELRGRLLALPVGLSGNIPLHFFVGRLKRHIIDFDPDCIYIYHEPYAVGTFQVLRAAKAVTSAPVGIRSAQNLNKRYPTPFRQWERRVYRESDFAVVVSDNVAQVMRAKGYHKPISIIPMPVDTRMFFPGAGRQDSVPLRIGFVGRLVPEKGVDTALRALAALPSGAAILSVIGDGPQRPALVDLAGSLGVADVVTWHGTLDREATADAYRGFDVVLVPSKATARWREQFGRVVIEAAASGVPVIATRSGELPFLVASLGAGWIVEEDDAAALADILRTLGEDREQLVSAGRRARRSVEETYSDQTVVRQLIETFTEAVSARSAE
jgi:glycosyltransferase involved in cell wall biosynthesis